MPHSRKPELASQAYHTSTGDPLGALVLTGRQWQDALALAFLYSDDFATWSFSITGLLHFLAFFSLLVT
jgi:hypothetical protein